MIRIKLTFAILACFLITGPVFSGSPTTMVNTTNSCVASTMNYNLGGTIRVVKQLNGFQNCNLVNNANATCNPGLASMTTQSLVATAIGSQITMNPSCNWSCAGCAGITTDGANGGLPVELMEFGIEQEGADE